MTVLYLQWCVYGSSRNAVTLFDMLTLNQQGGWVLVAGVTLMVLGESSAAHSVPRLPRRMNILH